MVVGVGRLKRVVKTIIKEKMGVAGGLPFRGGFLDKGPIEKIEEEAKKALNLAEQRHNKIRLNSVDVLQRTIQKWGDKIWLIIFLMKS